MKNIFILSILAIFANTLFAIEKYSKGDILYIVGEKVNLRTEPNLKSSVIKQLSKGSSLISLNTKYSKIGDGYVGEVNNEWEKILTGRWVKVNQNGDIGFIFDAYLSHYIFEEIGSLEFCFSNDTIRVAGYELYTRTIGYNGTIVESGTGIEWGREIYFIPDFTFEEAVLFLKPRWIDYKFGEQNWIVTENEILMNETDGISYRNLEIVKFGEYVIISNNDGV